MRRRSVLLFTLSSTVAILVIGVLIGWLISKSIKNEMIEAWSISTGAQVNGAVVTFVTEDELGSPFRGERYKELHWNIDRTIAGTDIVDVRIWRPDGTIIFSHDTPHVGQKFPKGESFARAKNGQPSAGISSLQEPYQKRLHRQYSSLIEVYYPIRFRGNHKVLGIFEIYLSVDHLNAYLRRASISLGAGLGVLGFLLIVFAQLSSNMLRNRNILLTELKDELEQREKESRRISETLQKSLIKPVPRISGLNIGVTYNPAYETEMVGGDFYDVFQLGPNHAAVLVGDVAGKGVEAAGLTETIRSSVRALAQIEQSPSFILNRLNQVLLPQVSEEEFATAVLMIVDTDTRSIKLANAGHPAPLTLGNTNHFLNAARGLPLGIISSLYTETSVQLESGGGFVLFTDGLIEARRNLEMFGENRVLEVVSTSSTDEPQILVENLLRAAADFTKGRLRDDVAIVAFRLV